MSSDRRDYVVVGVSLLSLCVIFATVGIVGYLYKPKSVNEFGVIVDISGNNVEINMYQWINAKRVKRTGKVVKKTNHLCNIVAYRGVQSSKNLRTPLFHCFNEIVDKISNFEWNNATHFVFGTDLTRLFCNNYPDECSKVFEMVREVIVSFELTLRQNGARPLNGSEEGVFGWIGVNDHFGTLVKPSLNKFATIDVKNSTIVVTSTDVGVTGEHVLESSVRVYGNDFLLRTMDYMCYGVTEGKKNVLLDLISKSPKTDIVYHSCYPSGAVFRVQTDELFGFCKSTHERGRFKQSYTVHGRFDLAACTEQIKKSIFKAGNTMDTKFATLVPGVVVADQSFYGFSELTEYSRRFNLKTGDTLADLHTTLRATCRAEPKVGSADDSKCFETLYSYVFIVDGLGINPLQVKVGSSEEAIETMSGSMTYYSSEISPKKSGFILGKMGLLSVLLSSLVFLGMGAYMLKT